MSSIKHEKTRTLSLYTGSQITSLGLFERANNCFTKLRSVNRSERPPPLVLALDEAHAMTKRDASSVPGSLLDIFCKVEDVHIVATSPDVTDL